MSEIEYVGHQEYFGKEKQITCNIPKELVIDFLEFIKRLSDLDHVFFNPRIDLISDDVVAFGFRPTFKGSHDSAKEQIDIALSHFTRAIPHYRILSTTEA
jgi:hypothetical protein